MTMNNIGKSIAGLSAVGLLLIATNEGFSPTPYKDTAGIVTNGFGNASINPSKTVTVVEALADLKTNTTSAGIAVNTCIHNTLTQGQYDSYVSLAYNVGNNAFCKSTMAKKANAGDRVGSCNEFDRWIYVAGKDCRIKSSNCSGIVKRRKAEKELCLS